MAARLRAAQKAADRDGLTLAQLYAYAQDAIHLGVDPQAHIKVSVGWRQQVIEISVSGDMVELPTADEEVRQWDA